MRSILGMVMPIALLLSLLTSALYPNSSEATEATAAADVDIENTHTELRALREALFRAWETRDLDALLANVDEDVVVTWQNAEVNRGHDGIRKFYQEMMIGDDRIVADISSQLEVDELAILYDNDTAIAFGSIRDDLTLNQSLARAAFVEAGSRFQFDSRWTATLVRKEGKWKLASYHTSGDIFDNPVLDLAINAASRTAFIAGGAGLLAGAALMFLFRRRIKS